MNRPCTNFFEKIMLFLAVILVSGCAANMSLQYEKPPIAEMNKGEVFIVIDDRRPADEGGNEPLRVGTIRNTFGMPFPLNARPDREPPKVIKDLISDCLMATGYKISDEPSNIPQMHVAIESFWGDGYLYNRLWTILHAELKKDSHSAPIWEQTFEISTSVVWSVGYEPFDRGINSLLEDLKAKLLVAFNDPKFHKSVKEI